MKHRTCINVQSFGPFFIFSLFCYTIMAKSSPTPNRSLPTSINDKEVGITEILTATNKTALLNSKSDTNNHDHDRTKRSSKSNCKNKKYFFIRSALNGLVLDARLSFYTDPKLKIHHFNGGDHQQWYKDPAGIIHSKISGYVLSSPEAFPEKMILSSYGSHRNQDWRLVTGGIIHSGEGQCLDVLYNGRLPGTHLVAHPCHGDDNQRWTIEEGPLQDDCKRWWCCHHH